MQTVSSITPKVYLVDDDSLMLDMFCSLIKTLGAKAIGFENAEAFLQEYQLGPCECVVSDMRMPGVSGLQLHKQLQTTYPQPPPLILVTGYAEVAMAVEAMKQGVFDFVEKPINGHQFLEKVQAALNFSRTLHQKRLQHSAREARLALLTAKEREVFEAVVQGLPSKEIAQRLDLSVRTVENHRARLMLKLRAKSALELMRDFGPGADA
jgi:two-component system, LuxR family, response regulator FixJ